MSLGVSDPEPGHLLSVHPAVSGIASASTTDAFSDVAFFKALTAYNPALSTTNYQIHI